MTRNEHLDLNYQLTFLYIGSTCLVDACEVEDPFQHWFKFSRWFWAQVQTLRLFWYRGDMSPFRAEGGGGGGERENSPYNLRV